MIILTHCASVHLPETLERLEVEGALALAELR